VKWARGEGVFIGPKSSGRSVPFHSGPKAVSYD
jgi:hypothetical protein